MPESSILIRAEDRYSDVVRRMADHTRAFSRDVDALQADLTALNRNRAQLRVDTTAAQRQLREAQRQFLATGSAADRLRYEAAQANYDNIRRNLNEVTRAARETERQIRRVTEETERAGDVGAAGAGASGFGRVAGAVVASAATQMIAPLVQQGAQAYFASAMGDANGQIASSILTSALSGAALGSMIAPGAGTAVGAVTGAAVGLASGMMQKYQAEDEAYMDWRNALYEDASAQTDAALAAGSATAGTREQTRMAYAQKLGGGSAADDYLEQVKVMAVKTNYTYDEITGYGKLLLNSYSPKETLGVLMSLSDATAGLNLDSSDVNQMISGLSRLRLSNHATALYLDYFRTRGVDTDQALAEALHVDKSQIAEMVTKKQIGGAEAAQAILDYIDREFGGLSDTLANSYNGLADNLDDVMANINSSMGEGYNEERKGGLSRQIEVYDGELGEAMSNAYNYIGKGRAALDNLKDQYTEEALSAVLLGKETALDWSDATKGELQLLSVKYDAAIAEAEAGDAAAGARAEAYMEEARALAQAEFESSAAMTEVADVETQLIQAITDNTAALNGWRSRFGDQQALSKGRASAYEDAPIVVTGKTFHRARGYATGLQRVPYNDFPALLHEDERVLTASEARSYKGGGGNVSVSGNTFVVRQESDIDAIAAALLEKLQQASMAGVV